jgi:hypothetical protein
MIASRTVFIIIIIIIIIISIIIIVTINSFDADNVNTA